MNLETACNLYRDTCRIKNI